MLESAAKYKQPLLELEEVTVRRAGRDILSQVSLSLAPGQILTVIGPNGAGKTTLAKAALGLIAPDGGVVRRPGGDEIGYVPQKLSLDPTLPLTVARFLSLARRGRSSLQVGEALAQVGAGHLASSAVQSLSGGEFQRVLLARAILRGPRLLVLDEPDQALDISGQNELYALIGKLRDELGCAVLMISHDLHLVMSATDEVICLHGHVCCAGHPEAVSEHPEYRRIFGSHAAGLAVYHHSHDHAHDLGGEVVEGAAEGHGEHV